MISIGYEPGTKGYHFWLKIRRTVVISSTAAFDKFDFLNCPREKLQANHLLPKFNLPKWAILGIWIMIIMIKEEMTVTNLLIMINLRLHLLVQNLIMDYQIQISRKMMKISMDRIYAYWQGTHSLGCCHVHQTHKGVHWQDEPDRGVLLLPLYHLDHQSHLDLHFHLTHLHLQNLLWAMGRNTPKCP